MEKYFLGVYNDKSNVNQALESNYLECNCLYSQKKTDSEKPCGNWRGLLKNWVDRQDTDEIFKNKFDLCVPIM